MSSDETRNQILDSAEALFAERGFEGASLRQIMTQAGANLAAGHYHFGGKDKLLMAVLERRIGPINEERLRMLEELEEKYAKRKRIPVEPVLEALLAPALRMVRSEQGAGNFVVLLGRILSDPNKELLQQFHSQFDEICMRFMPVFRNSLPNLTDDEAMWRLFFVIGTMAHTMMSVDKISFVSQGQCSMDDMEDVIAKMVRFCAAGLKAPVPVKGETV